MYFFILFVPIQLRMNQDFVGTVMVRDLLGPKQRESCDVDDRKTDTISTRSIHPALNRRFYGNG